MEVEEEEEEEEEEKRRLQAGNVGLLSTRRFWMRRSENYPRSHINGNPLKRKSMPALTASSLIQRARRSCGKKGLRFSARSV